MHCAFRSIPGGGEVDRTNDLVLCPVAFHAATYDGTRCSSWLELEAWIGVVVGLDGLSFPS